MAGSIPESERAILENAYPDHRSPGKAYFTLKWVDEYVQPILSDKYNRMRYRFLRVRMASAYAGADHALAREIVGHDSEISHQLHIRPSDDQRKEAMEKLSEMIVPWHAVKIPLRWRSVILSLFVPSVSVP